MPFSLLADQEIRAITELTPEWFSQHGIRLMLLDFDNTMIPYTTSEASEEFTQWYQNTLDAGIKVMVVSNSRKSRRVPDFCEPRGIPFIRHAGKPSPKGILKAMAQMQERPEATAMAGDQTYTDVLAANRAGVMSILVQPLKYSSPFHYLRRGIEMPFILTGRKKRKR